MTYKQRNNPRKLEVIKDEEFLSPWVLESKLQEKKTTVASFPRCGFVS